MQLESLMTGKRGLIMGVANDRSIAWGIASTLANHGASLAICYQNEILEKRVRPLAQSLEAELILPCDVASETSISQVVDAIGSKWGRIDFLVHAIAYSDKHELDGRYVTTSRANFLQTLDISCYSFTALCRQLEPLMSQGGSLLTMTYYGAERVMPHYNVMGVAKAALEASVRYLAADLGPQAIRVNAISAGPIKTLAASGISGFRYILQWNAHNAPLQRNVTLQEIGNSALYLLSDLGSGVSGEVLHVDCGYHTTGMLAVDKAAESATLLQDFVASRPAG